MNNSDEILKNKEKTIVVSNECFNTMSYHERFTVILAISNTELRHKVREKLSVTDQYYILLVKGIGTNNKPISEKAMRKHFLVAKECFKEYYKENEIIINQLTA
jgi:hypothetical protein